MRSGNRFAIVTAFGVLVWTADQASAQVEVKPGGVTVTNPTGATTTVPFTGQPPTLLPPGASGTYPGNYPSHYTPGPQWGPTTSYYAPQPAVAGACCGAAVASHCGSYVQPMYGNDCGCRHHRRGLFRRCR